jgi:hypothetical protein
MLPVRALPCAKATTSPPVSIHPAAPSLLDGFLDIMIVNHRGHEAVLAHGVPDVLNGGNVGRGM